MENLTVSCQTQTPPPNRNGMIRDMKAAALEGLRLLPLFIGFIGLYYVLDKVSFGHPLFGLSITPWRSQRSSASKPVTGPCGATNFG